MKPIALSAIVTAAILIITGADMRALTLSGMAIAALALSACSEKAADKVDAASQAVGQDIERGINNADDHIQSGLEKTGKAIDKAGDDLSAATADASRKADIAAKKAQKDAGAALQKTGKDLQN
jgi:hypothetical protein